jgi:cytoskeletal protein RodZ
MGIKLNIKLFIISVILCISFFLLLHVHVNIRENLTNLSTPTPTINTVYGDLIATVPPNSSDAVAITQQKLFVNEFFPNHAFDEPGITAIPTDNIVLVSIPYDPVNNPGNTEIPTMPTNPLLPKVTISESLSKLYTNQTNSIIDYSGATSIERKMNPNPQDVSMYIKTYNQDPKDKLTSNMYIV